jgi:hypothetical protein
MRTEKERRSTANLWCAGYALTVRANKMEEAMKRAFGFLSVTLLLFLGCATAPTESNYGDGDSSSVHNDSVAVYPAIYSNSNDMYLSDKIDSTEYTLKSGRIFSVFTKSASDSFVRH